MYKDILLKQKEYFNTGVTLDINNRLNLLKKLYKEIKNQEENIVTSLNKDLGKSSSEAYMCEIGLVLSELTYLIKNLKKLTKKQYVKTPIAHFYSRSYQLAFPYGNTLIISPWNYPFLLSLNPLISSIAAGNTVILKPSEYSIYTNKVIKEIINNVFSDEHVCIIEGEKEVSISLLELKFDYIFFTGNKNVGRSVYIAASKNLTPVTLELGGKSPCIVDKSANIALSAKRIVFGKFINLGQTCVAPDYIICHEDIKNKLIKELINQINIQYNDALNSMSYGKIISEIHYKRIKEILLAQQSKCIYGSNYNDSLLKIEPTLLDNISFNDLIMQNEIFAPILPILTYKDELDLIKLINEKESPLACYIFSNNKKNVELLSKNLYFGGCCINDTIVHLANTNLGFGGYKESGIGSYHGKKGFDTFSHYKSILDKKNFIDLPLRYRPYNKFKDKLVKIFVK